MYEEIKRPKEVSRQQLPMIVKVNLNRFKNPQQKSSRGKGKQHIYLNYISQQPKLINVVK